MRDAWPVSAVAFAAIACAPEDQLWIPLPLQGAGSEILALRVIGRDDPPVLFARDFDDPNVVLPLSVKSEDGVSIEALTYEVSLCDLGLEAGVVPAAGETETGRCLPYPNHRFSLTLPPDAGEADAQRWEEAGEPSELVTTVRLPADSGGECIAPPASCLARRGCVSAETGQCLVPCPEPSPPGLPVSPSALTGTVTLAALAPSFTDCPTGWVSVTGTAGVVTCEPWGSAGGNRSCPPGEVRFPGDAQCRRLGTVCSPGGWPDFDPEGRPVVYVRRGGGTGGNGTMAAPHGTLRAAFQNLRRGSIIAVAPGTYDETLRANVPVKIIGTCPERTVIAPSGAGVLLTVTSTGVEIENITLLAADGSESVRVVSGSLEAADVRLAGGGLFVRPRGAVVLERVEIAQSAGTGFHAGNRDPQDTMAARLTGRNVIIRGARGYGAIADGRGSVVELTDFAITEVAPVPNEAVRPTYSAYSVGGATLRLTRGVIEDVDQYGAVADDGSTVVANQVVVREVSAPENGRATAGLYALNGGRLDLTRVRVERTRYRGVELDEGSASLDRVVVFDILGHPAKPNDGGGIGVSVDDGSTLLARQLWVENAGRHGLYIGPTATASVTDFVALGTRPDPATERLGDGIRVNGGRLASLRRARVEANAHDGIAVDGGQLTAEDVVIAGTAAARHTVGLRASLGAAISIDRVSIAGNACGVRITRDAPVTTITLEDAQIVQNRATPASEATGCGIEVAEPPGVSDLGTLSLKLQRVTVEDNEGGVNLALGGDLSGGDLTIRRTASPCGLQLSAGGSAVLDRILIDEASCTLIGVGGQGTATLSNVTLRDSAQGRAEVGATVMGGGRLSLNHFLADLPRSRVFAACAADDRIELLDGTVRGVHTGFSSAASFEAEMVARGVRYEGVAVPFCDRGPPCEVNSPGE